MIFSKLRGLGKCFSYLSIYSGKWLLLSVKTRVGTEISTLSEVSVSLSILPGEAEPRRKIMNIHHGRRGEALWGLRPASQSVTGGRGQQDKLQLSSVRNWREKEEESMGGWRFTLREFLESPWDCVQCIYLCLFTGMTSTSQAAQDFLVFSTERPASQGILNPRGTKACLSFTSFDPVLEG